jgi:uncharacterized protein (DUF2141 family)
MMKQCLTKRFSTGLFLLVVLFSSFFAAWAQFAAPITVEVSGIRNDRGDVCLLLFNSPDGFPDHYKKAFRLLKTPAQKGSVTAEFSQIPSGTYGISVLHDEDRNEKLRKNWLGIPREGFGFSNNASARFSPPPFSAVRFAHGKMATTTIRLKVRY